MSNLLPPENLIAAIDAILGPGPAHAVLGEDFTGLTAAMELAAIRCFRRQRPEDEHTKVLRAAFDAATAGKL